MMHRKHTDPLGDRGVIERSPLTSILEQRTIDSNININ